MTFINYTNVTNINETIKQIVQISRQVNLAALNAMFLSRKGGDRTVGFATVTTEMRKFSNGLDQQMLRLADSLTSLIYALSMCKKVDHTSELMHQALDKSGPLIQEDIKISIIERMEAKINNITKEIEATTQNVFKQLEKSEEICNVGQNLAVLAKIESQSGGEYEAALMNVSNTIEDIILRIENNLQQAKTIASRAS